MASDSILKRILLKEIVYEGWKKTVPDEAFQEKTRTIDEIRAQNLELVKRRNQGYKRHSPLGTRTVKNVKVNSEAEQSYTSWKAANKMKACPEAPGKKLLVLLRLLDAKAFDAKRSPFDDCLKLQKSKLHLAWDCPGCNLRALRQCLLKRDWVNMTRLLPYLLLYRGKYLTIIQNICKLMLKYNPLVKQCGLEDQFKQLLGLETQNLNIV